MMLNLGPECLQGCEVACSQPCAYSRSLEPCVASCGDSRAVVYPPPVVLTFPGPTLSTCSQESVVGASHPMVFGAPNVSDESYGVGGSFGGMGGPGGSFGTGSSFGYGGSSGIAFGRGGSFGSGMQNSRGSCGYGSALGVKGSFGSGGAFGYGGSLGMGGSVYSRRSRSSRGGSYVGSWGSC